MQIFAVIVLVFFLCYTPAIYKRIINNFKLRFIPTVGSSNPLTSYIGAYRFRKHAQEVVKEGHNKYRGSIFRIPTMTHWMIIASAPDQVEQIRRAPDDILSTRDASRETFDVGLPPSHRRNDDLAHLVRIPFTRNIDVKFPDVRDEIIAAFSDHIPAKSDEWIKITAYPTLMDIVCRASNRMIVGLPICRDPDYLELNKQFTIDAVNAAYILSMVPAILKPVIIPFLNTTKGIKRGVRHLGPLVKERLEQEAQCGKDWAERPNDILSWLVEIPNGRDLSLEEIAHYMLLINFAAIHTTTITVTHSLYNLATYPEYVQPLREEIETVIQEEGWSKASVSKMTKLDSFVKETMRLSQIAAFLMTRKTMKDFTFSDGMTIPAGNLLSVAASCIHTDPENHVDPEIFDGLRFEKMREKEGEPQSRHSFVSLNLDYVLFGHGRHACPGRFFAANELKAMLAHILLNYDVKMANGGGRPENMRIGQSSLPNTKAEVLFRKRV